MALANKTHGFLGQLHNNSLELLMWLWTISWVLVGPKGPLQ
jgi:hypothetical protein